MSEATAPRPAFGRTFWTLNCIEMFERLAFYSFRPVAPIYIMQADDPGGLHLNAAQKGSIYAWWAIFQSLLPIVTGGFADRYGYKKTMAFSFTLMTVGYILMAFMRDLTWISNYPAFFGAVLVMATGTAFFKPSIQGSLAQNLTKANSSLGWGIFYWVVNVGGVIGPFLATALLARPDSSLPMAEQVIQGQAAWRNLFLAAAGISSLNFIFLLTFKDVPSGANKTDGMFAVLVKTVSNIFDARLITWLIIMSGFWLMMYQLWDLHPNFIADWVDSNGIARSLEWLPERAYRWITINTDRGVMIPQQMLLNLNGICILALIIPVSWMVRHMRTLSAMLIGMIVATCGILVGGLTANGWVLALGIVLFSLGEMTTGPKKNEYLGLIAPPGKKGLYLGYVNIPVGVGVFIGSKVAGFVYGQWGEKAVLALRYLAEKTPFGEGKGWDGSTASLETALGISRPEAMAKLQEVTGLDAVAATRLLWDTYEPQYIVWIPFAVTGMVCAVALWVFGRMAKRWSDMNA